MRPEDLPVEHRTAATNGIRLHYVEAGARDRPLVVLLHGFPEFWWSWRFQIQPLVDAGFRVIVPDQRGYNLSEKLGPYDVDTLVADVAGLIEHAGCERAHIVGHDWGGNVAWHFAAQRPEMCERLVVLNCPHPVMMKRALRTSAEQRRKSWYIFLFQVPVLAERYLLRNNAEPIARTFYAGAVDRSRIESDELDAYRKAMQRPGAAHATVGWYRAAVRDALSRKKRDRFPGIGAATTLIWARPDFALDFSACVPGTERYVPNLKLRVLDGVGHFCQTEAPERVTPLLLEALTASGSGGA